jgi:hypothetical protein
MLKEILILSCIAGYIFRTHFITILRIVDFISSSLSAHANTASSPNIILSCLPCISQKYLVYLPNSCPMPYHALISNNASYRTKLLFTVDALEQVWLILTVQILYIYIDYLLYHHFYIYYFDDYDYQYARIFWELLKERIKLRMHAIIIDIIASEYLLFDISRARRTRRTQCFITTLKTPNGTDAPALNGTPLLPSPRHHRHACYSTENILPQHSHATATTSTRHASVSVLRAR